MTRLIALALVVLAACAPPDEPPPQDPSEAALPAPTPDEIEIRINAARDGQIVEVPLHQRFAVELVGVPTAGYVWTPAQMPAFLTRAGEAGGPTIAAQNEPGYAGGHHWEVLMFVATAPGEGELVLEQKRPWETDQAPVDVFRVTILAR
jgi:predicted secreted protein